MTGPADPKKESTVLLARLAVRHGMLDQASVDRVLEFRRRRGSVLPLGELLLQLGHITREQFDRLMATTRTSSVICSCSAGGMRPRATPKTSGRWWFPAAWRRRSWWGRA